MKNSIYLFFLLAFVGISCDENQEISEDIQEQIIGDLQGTWATNEVRKDNALVPDFSDFRLTINDKSYTSENGAPVWPDNGTFDFENIENENEFVRSDGRLFTAAIDDLGMKVTVVYQDISSRGEFGTYEFTMIKN